MVYYVPFKECFTVCLFFMKHRGFVTFPHKRFLIQRSIQTKRSSGIQPLGSIFQKMINYFFKTLGNGLNIVGAEIFNSSLKEKSRLKMLFLFTFETTLIIQVSSQKCWFAKASILNKVFKNGPRKICGIHPFKRFYLVRTFCHLQHPVRIDAQ